MGTGALHVHSLIHELKCPVWQPMCSIIMLEIMKNLMESVQKGVSGVRKGLMDRVIGALSLEIDYSNGEVVVLPAMVLSYQLQKYLLLMMW